jgi:hypothetical protein
VFHLDLNRTLQVFLVGCFTKVEQVTNEKVLEHIGEKRTLLIISCIEKTIRVVIF